MDIREAFSWLEGNNSRVVFLLEKIEQTLEDLRKNLRQLNYWKNELRRLRKAESRVFVDPIVSSINALDLHVSLGIQESKRGLIQYNRLRKLLREYVRQTNHIAEYTDLRKTLKPRRNIDGKTEHKEQGQGQD